MVASPHDFIVAADVRELLAVPLVAAQRHVGRSGRGPLARLVARVSGVRELAAAVRETLAAIRASADWQRARIVALEELVASLAATARPRAWLGPAERPVLLVGAGGSGTRVLGEAALRLGVGLGPRVNESFDSVAWAPLVYDMVLGRGGGSILATAEAVHAPWLFGDRPWGIKLPELTLVLPRFVEAFPAARVVFLSRHPVSASLRRHHLTSSWEHPVGRVVLEDAYRGTGRDPARDGTRCPPTACSTSASRTSPPTPPRPPPASPPSSDAPCGPTPSSVSTATASVRSVATAGPARSCSSAPRWPGGSATASETSYTTPTPRIRGGASTWVTSTSRRPSRSTSRMARAVKR
jgi:hypothetical protein